MKICIIGIARSGTTALYSLLQEIMRDDSGKDVEYVYEPFLWDKDYFNDRYDLVQRNFDRVDAISIEGIFNHLTLPMLIADPKPYKNNEYLKRIFNPTTEAGIKKKNVILKFIRAAGRYLLLETIAPKTKFIYIIRNPADTINSIFGNFSFYGGEFHKDDFPRFLGEVNDIYSAKHAPEDFKTQAEKELFYWFYMNKFALQSFARQPNKPLILCHEEITRDRKSFIEQLCTYIDVPIKPGYTALSTEKVGHTTKRFKAHPTELELMDHCLGKYTSLLAEHGIRFSFTPQEILKKYEAAENPVFLPSEIYGLSPLKFKSKYERDKKTWEIRINEKENIIKEKENRLKQQKAQYEERLKQVYDSTSFKLGSRIVKMFGFLPRWLPFSRRKKKHPVEERPASPGKP